MASVTTRAKYRRRDLVRTILFGTLLPAFFLALPLLAQPDLGGAMRADWWFYVLAFVVGAVVVALPRRFPALAALVALLVFAWLSTMTKFVPIVGILNVLAGFWFGLAVRSLVFQFHRRKSPVKSPASVRCTWDEGEGARGSVDASNGADVDARINAMQGAGRSTVSVFRGSDRLDVVCVRSAGFLVFSTGASGRVHVQFQALPSGALSPDPRDTVDVVVAGSPASYPRGRFVTREDALAAAKTFVATGGREASLTWDVGTRSHEIPVPPGLA